MQHAAALAELLDQQSPAPQVLDLTLLTRGYHFPLQASSPLPKFCFSVQNVHDNILNSIEGCIEEAAVDMVNEGRAGAAGLCILVGLIGLTQNAVACG